MANSMTLSTPVYRDPISWPLLPKPTADGVLAYPDLDRSVRDAIRILLLTRPGEQLMRPRFGAGLDNFRDENNALAVRRRIQLDITNTLQAYEPRIALDRIDVDPVADAPGEIHIRIHYRLVRTGQAQTMGATLTS
jgi:phage baseplate assembly protein W